MSSSAMSGFADIIRFYYPEDTPLRRLLLRHSVQVRDKALSIAGDPGCPVRGLDRPLLVSGAMLHDLGIVRCQAPGILCRGGEPYIAHGVIGAAMLREYQRSHPGADLEGCARICERHTGTGLTAEDIRRQGLPLPPRDLLPETPEEKLVCLADKFFSKSGDMREKPLRRIREEMERFGEENLRRFAELCRLFGVREESRRTGRA